MKEWKRECKRGKRQWKSESGREWNTVDDNGRERVEESESRKEWKRVEARVNRIEEGERDGERGNRVEESG